VRYLFLTDLHSNWQALEAVLRHANDRYERVVCCGDLVGYGADPNPVVEWVRANCAVVVRGNHDRAATGQEDLEWFNPVARAAAIWTARALSAENAAYVRELAKGPCFIEGIEVLHGSPCDEDDYLIAADDASDAFAYLESRLAFFGHTHLQGGFIWDRERVEMISPVPLDSCREVMDINPQRGYLINPGSVGQPRDGDPRAAYALYNSDAAVLSYCRVKYDVEAACRKIRDAGLPPVLADRLSVGR